MPAIKGGVVFALLFVTVSDPVFHPPETLSGVFHVAPSFCSPLRNVIDFKPYSNFEDVRT